MTLLLLLGCATDPADPKDTDPADTDPADDTGEPPVECEPAPLPVAQAYLPGFTGAEDFAFDDEGYLVSVDSLGNLVGIDRAGNQKLILPDASMYAAGTRFLPDGDLVFCDAATGSLVRVDTATGGSQVVLGGLEYPNGLDVDLDGAVYVAEQITGRVRRIDPATGEYSIVARGLYNPNGVSFSPDYQRMYVGSFGGGVVWAVDREGDGWGEPRIYATTPEAPGVQPDWCDTALEGDECPLNGGYGLGRCKDDEGADLYCGSAVETAACEGLAEGDACTSTLFGEPVAQTCHAGSDGALFCPRTELAHSEACEGKAESEVCFVGEDRGACYSSFEGVLACYVSSGWETAYTADCEGRAIGDTCAILDPLYPSLGTCTDGADWGLPGLACLPSGISGTDRGGLDGVNVDTCGNLYVTEFVHGHVWRFDAEGAEPQLVVDLDSEWIPNLHWGNGVGGWERDVLYVMDRGEGGLFELQVGVEGHQDAWVP